MLRSCSSIDLYHSVVSTPTMGIRFSSQDTGANPWKLDVAGLLAILGEKNVLLSSHLITSSWLCFLPRLMPAPQALLATRRMQRLPQEDDVTVIGVYNGNKKKTLNYFATLLHQQTLDDAEFNVRHLEIFAPKHGNEVEIRQRTWSPINIVTVSSFLLTLGLAFLAWRQRDGTGLLAVLVMSLSTTLLCAASHWRPKLPARRAPRKTEGLPEGDVVIRTPKGSFLVVHCPENISRKLYFAPEDCQYSMSSTTARALGGLGAGIGLISAVILFANSTWPVQVAVTVTYGVLNLAYWFAAVLPAQLMWDFSDFMVISQRGATRTNFTGALAAAIQFSKSAEWVIKSEAAPNSVAWRQWLDLADSHISGGNDTWFEDKSHDPKADLTHFQGALTYYLQRGTQEA